MHQLALRTHALALLPERQAYYDSCCQTLERAVVARNPRAVFSAQLTVCYALASLNRTRAAAGLSCLAGPVLRSLDELFSLAEITTSLSA